MNLSNRRDGDPTRPDPLTLRVKRETIMSVIRLIAICLIYTLKIEVLAIHETSRRSKATFSNCETVMRFMIKHFYFILYN